ncbi:protein EIN4-like isoform X2 [Tripterygium wilfordii]|uniref:protein EIN4-like isoform X2 n=1 Tax=Tripterygium wilfordii TaxID=458696 RepID=UPI0018F84F54|nr:protein EIN4-like isoform X2 [Tripterygium wilfordii]
MGYGAMSRALAPVLLISYFTLSVMAVDTDFVNCVCDDEGFWSLQNILQCQKVSDFLIAVAYFSIPIELLYFVSCSDVPFKLVLLQFVAFIVLCGLTHLLNGWTYYGPHSFQLMLSLTIAKFLTALVSCATAITLFTLIPLLLKLKVRELFLKQNVLELGQEVGLMKKQKEASLHVRMLTQEIRKSLNKLTIVHTTLVELSNTLNLHNCAIWMPNESKKEMKIKYELNSSASKNHCHSISTFDPDVLVIRGNRGVRVLKSYSLLGAASGGGSDEAGAMAAVRMPMLNVSNFKGGTPELVDTCYAILVLVLPHTNSRGWTSEEMEMVEAVSDQVAVALSHASVLEESQLTREKLVEQNRALQEAKKKAMMANQARNSFQKVMSYGLRRPMHSILGLLSMFQGENMSIDQRLIIDSLSKTSNVLSTLINDVMEMSTEDNERFSFETRPFQLHSVIKEASCLAKCLSLCKGFGFKVDVQSSVPDWVMGDERRTFQVILHMVGYLLNSYDGEGMIIFHVVSQSEMLMWRLNCPDNYVSVKFEIAINKESSQSEGSTSIAHSYGKQVEHGRSFNMCKKLVQVSPQTRRGYCRESERERERLYRIISSDLCT